MNKEQAAKKIGISVRTLQRHMAANRIAYAMKRTKTGDVADFNKDEVERFRRELKEGLTASVRHGTVESSGPVSPMPADGAGHNEQTALALAQPAQVALLERLASVLGSIREARPAVPLADKPLLKLDEAAQLTGLSRGILREAVEKGSLKAKIVGRAWRIKRADLDAYIAKL
jgi:excisionase family DNA binding protein